VPERELQPHALALVALVADEHALAEGHLEALGGEHRVADAEPLRLGLEARVRDRLVTKVAPSGTRLATSATDGLRRWRGLDDFRSLIRANGQTDLHGDAGG
jgi:hypothetical protein